MTSCSQCSRDIENDSRFCRHCGAGQATASDAGPLGNLITPAPTPLLIEPEPTGGDNVIRVMLIVAGVFFVIILLAVMIGQHRSAQPPLPDIAMTNALDTVTADPLLDNATAAPIAPVPARTETWSYSTDEDKVRGATTYFATTTSTNSIHQAAPYDGDTTMTVTVRKSPAFGTDVLLSISSGQMMCPSYEGCSGTVRFDDSAPQSVRFNGSTDNSSDTIFVGDAAGFIAKLKKAKKLIVEKTLYEAGNPQFEFDVSGLKWDH